MTARNRIGRLHTRSHYRHPRVLMAQEFATGRAFVHFTHSPTDTGKERVRTAPDSPCGRSAPNRHQIDAREDERCRPSETTGGHGERYH
jgi:hypothetical protein